MTRRMQSPNNAYNETALTDNEIKLSQVGKPHVQPFITIQNLN